MQPLTRSRMKIHVVELAERDPSVPFKQAALKAIGDLSKYEVLYSTVLLATYVAPRKTAGGIIKPDAMIDEDRYQGNVGLVLKMGPDAFKFNGVYPYDGVKAKVGQYVAFLNSDTREVGIRGNSCKYIDSSRIMMIVPDPDDLY